MCKFGNKNLLSTLCDFGGIFSTFKLSVFTENGNFHFLLNIVSATFYGLITHINKVFQNCANSNR